MPNCMRGTLSFYNLLSVLKKETYKEEESYKATRVVK